MRNAKGKGGSKIVRKAWGKGKKLGGGGGGRKAVRKAWEEGRKKGGKKEGRLAERKQGKRKAWRK